MRRRPRGRAVRGIMSVAPWGRPPFLWPALAGPFAARRKRFFLNPERGGGRIRGTRTEVTLRRRGHCEHAAGSAAKDVTAPPARAMLPDDDGQRQRLRLRRPAPDGDGARAWGRPVNVGRTRVEPARSSSAAPPTPAIWTIPGCGTARAGARSTWRVRPHAPSSAWPRSMAPR
jgi:hypothetical protein